MKVIDLFAGCGGMSLGFTHAGFQIVKAYDNWDAAIKCYSENFNHEIENADLGDVKSVVRDILKYDFDIIIGGPPCQDFSHAGKRTEGQRADLTESFAEIISMTKPEWFVMENVDRMAKSNAYSNARKIFKTAGYGLTEILLNASLCGVPQTRKRFFVIGNLTNEDHFLESYLNDRQSTKPLTIKEYFNEDLDFEYYYRHPRNYNRRAIFSIYEPSPTIRGVNRPIPSGYAGHVKDPIKVDATIRPLTTEERAQIQTFPKTFKFYGSKTDNEQLIGNAVPVNLAKFVGESITLYIKKKCPCKQMVTESAF